MLLEHSTRYGRSSLDKARHIEPFEAMMADRHGPLANGAHTPRVIGFRPKRCSSVAQISILASGCLRRSAAAAPWSFF